MNDKFTVYTNPNIPKRPKKEEVTFQLEIPDEDTITGLFVSSPYFYECMQRPDFFYYPVDLEAEQTMLAPLLHKEVLEDFLSDTEDVREKEDIPVATLLHIVTENEDGEDMECIFEGMIQFEFIKFFQTAVMITNPEVVGESTFPEAFGSLIEELTENGYLDQVLLNICSYMSDPEVLEELLFSKADEE